jgi:phenylacetate-CoA ligase
LRRRRLPWLHGYPSMLALLASYVVESGDALGYSVSNVTTGAENLLPQQAAVIEQAFGVKPVQNYGMAEGVANFSEFRDERLYVDEDFAAVEFVKNEGGGYKVVGTNFTNLATPLVRYEVGDLVELPAARGGGVKAAAPGREVAAIDGRQEEYVVLRNGVRIGRMDHVFKDMTQIREAQIVQRGPGDILVRVVRGAKYGGGDEARLRQEFYQRVGHEADVKIEYVDAIEKTARGKLRFVVAEDSVQGSRSKIQGPANRE